MVLSNYSLMYHIVLIPDTHTETKMESKPGNQLERVFMLCLITYLTLHYL